MRILAVGIATMDIVSQVAAFPSEDDEVRAISQRHARGGNATNSLVVLAQAGHDCHWAGNLGDDLYSQFALDDLQRHGIDCEAVIRIQGASLPVSCVTLSQASGSRTIVHYRDLPEYDAAHFLQLDLESFDWIHFEGRHVESLKVMMEHLLSIGFRNFSLEVEKPRKAIESLFDLPAVLLFSQNYVRQVNHSGVRDFLHSLRNQGVSCEVYCAWGKRGGWAMSASGKQIQQPAWMPEKVVDTLGAGDVFNAAVIDARSRGNAVEDVLAMACRLAGEKCGRTGFDGLVPE